MTTGLSNLMIYFIWNVIDMAIILRYMNRLYGRVMKHRLLYRLAIVLLILFTTISMNPGEGYLNPFAITVMGLFLLVFYPSNLQKKILFSAILVAITSFWTTASYTVISMLPDFHGFLNIMLCHLGLFVLLEVAPNFLDRRRPKIPIHIWILLLFIVFSSIAALFCIFSLLSNGELTRHALLMLTPVIFLLLLINFFIFFLFDRFSRLMTAATEKSLLEQQITYQKQQFYQLESSQEQIRSIRHDMKNSLQTIYYMLENDKLLELNEYLHTLNGSINAAQKIIVTQNSSIDSVLNMKLSEIEEGAINISTDIIIPAGLQLTFEQSVILFGNIMDNAIEASMRLPQEKRFLHLKMSYTNQILLISLQNSVEQPPLMTHDRYITGKEDKLQHGLGLKNVKRVVGELHGTMQTECSENTFHIKIMLYHCILETKSS